MNFCVKIKGLFLTTGLLYCVGSVATPIIKSDLNVLQNWSSNSLLVQNQQAEKEWITEVKPKIKMISDQAATHFLNYQLQAMHYMNRTKSDHIFHQGQLKSSYEPIHKKLNITLLGDYTQQILDPSSQYQRNNRVGSRLPDSLTISAIPSYYHERGAHFTQVSLAQSYAKFFDADQSDTLDTNYTLLHRKKRKIGPPSYEVVAHWRQTRSGEVNTSIKKEIQSHLNFPLFRTIWVLQGVGYENIVDKSNVVQRENGYSEKTGFGYFPTEYFYATFLAGLTPYGKQAESEVSFNRGMTELTISLNESVHNSIQEQIDALPTVINPVISPNVLTLQLPFMNDTFVSRKADLLLKRKSQTVSWTMKVGHTQERTLHTEQTVQARGIGGLVEWSVKKNHLFQLQGAYQKQKLFQDINQKQWLMTTAYHYQLLPTQRITLQLQHFNRELIRISKVTESQIGFNYFIEF